MLAFAGFVRADEEIDIEAKIGHNVDTLSPVSNSGSHGMTSCEETKYLIAEKEDLWLLRLSYLRES